MNKKFVQVRNLIFWAYKTKYLFIEKNWVLFFMCVWSVLSSSCVRDGVLMDYVQYGFVSCSKLQWNREIIEPVLEPVCVSW